MRSPITELVQRVSALAEQIHALPEDERNYLLDLLIPEVTVKPKAKQKRKSGTKSTRATKLGEQLKTNLSQREAKEPICAICGNMEDYVDLSQPSPQYHPFQAQPLATVTAAGATS